MNAIASFSKKQTKRWIVAGISLLVGVLAMCAFFRIHRPKDLVAYYGMADECHPVWRQFAFRRFGSGDSVADLLRRFPPTDKEEFGRYGLYRYELGSGEGIFFTGLSVASRDGRIISAGAGSCTWQFTFFEASDPALDAEYAAFTKERSERFRRQRERSDRSHDA
jgi:hypothetical protein